MINRVRIAIKEEVKIEGGDDGGEERKNEGGAGSINLLSQFSIRTLLSTDEQ